MEGTHPRASPASSSENSILMVLCFQNWVRVILSQFLFLHSFFSVTDLGLDMWFWSSRCKGKLAKGFSGRQKTEARSLSSHTSIPFALWTLLMMMWFLEMLGLPLPRFYHSDFMLWLWQSPCLWAPWGQAPLLIHFWAPSAWHRVWHHEPMGQLDGSINALTESQQVWYSMSRKARKDWGAFTNWRKPRRYDD